MRCKHCNVDLPDCYTVCPLCNQQAADEPAVIKGILYVDYPDKKGVEELKPLKIKRGLSFERVKAFFNT